MLLIGTMTLLMTLYTLICDSALAQSVYTRYSRWRHRNRVKPVEAPAEGASAIAGAGAMRRGGACAGGVHGRGRGARSARQARGRRGRTSVSGSIALGAARAARPSRATPAPSLGVWLSPWRPRAVIRQGEPRDPGAPLCECAPCAAAVARPPARATALTAPATAAFAGAAPDVAAAPSALAFSFFPSCFSTRADITSRRARR